MAHSVAFHARIASIVEVLANAAVAEICTFVDDGYAVLRLEVSQSRKENEALKRRLRTLERRLAQGRAKGAGLRDNFANNRPAIPALDKSGRITDGQLGEQVNIVLWRDGREGHAPDVTTPVESTDTGEREPKASSIKQEEPEEDPRNSESPQEPKISRERAVGSRAGGGGRPPVQETQNKAENHTEELTEQHRTRHGVWEVSGPESVLKAEAESESVKTLQHRGAERRAGGLNSLDSGFVMFERPAGQLGTYCTQGNGEVDGYDPSEIDLDSVSVHSELWSVPRVEEGLGRSLSSSVSGGAEVVMMDPVPVKMEVAMQPAWSMQSRSRDRVGTQHTHRDWERATNVRTTYTEVTVGESTALPHCDQLDMNGCVSYENISSRSLMAIGAVGTRRQSYVCKYCGKSCTRASGLKVHQRVHTGEKPFSCAQCGKKFSQSCSLKKHLILHTGEKPFSCAQCGKQFSDSSNLRKHRSIHTGERPFGCSQCGKRFNQSCNLKTHMRIHTGEK